MITFFKQKIKNFFYPVKKTQDSYVGSIKFILGDNDKINISCELPNINTKSLEEISKIAEAYAKFLLRVTDVSAIGEITKQLKSKTKDQNPDTVLFVDNVLFFGDLLMQENQKKMYKEIFSTEPLIRPSAVFSLKN
jgi:hypothetical protein